MLFLKPKLPIELAMREWVDLSMQRFSDIFGTSLSDLKVVTPTHECFPDEWDGTEDSVEPLFCRICSYMGVQRSTVDSEIFVDEDRERIEALRQKIRSLETDRDGAAGHYHGKGESGKPIVSLNRSELTNISRVISTLAHELGHVLLLGGRMTDRDALDMEPLTDLVTVYRGLGLFSANTALDFRQYQLGNAGGWQVKRLGYLSEQTYGYALAVIAWKCGQHSPAWAKYLKLNVKTYLKDSLAVLRDESRRR